MPCPTVLCLGLLSCPFVCLHARARVVGIQIFVLSFPFLSLFSVFLSLRRTLAPSLFPLCSSPRAVLSPFFCRSSPRNGRGLNGLRFLLGPYIAGAVFFLLRRLFVGRWLEIKSTVRPACCYFGVFPFVHAVDWETA